MALAAEKCAPCKGEENKIPGDQVRAMLSELKDWQTLDMESKLFKDFKFKDYMTALAFVNRISELAEEQGHHPDVSFGWGYAEIVLSTHDVGGLSRNDFILAAKIDGMTQP